MIQNKEDRIAEIDVIKALGVFFMIMLHMFVWWVSSGDYAMQEITNESVQIVLLMKVIGFFVFMIPITAGASLFFVFRKLEGKRNVLMVLVKRALLLLAIGYLANALAFGVGDITSWDVLHFMALSTLVLFAIARTGSYVPEIIFILFIVCSQLVRYVPGKENLGYFGVIFFGNSSGDHYWAFFPWFMLVFFGYLFMCWRERGLLDNPLWRKGIMVCAFVIVTIAMLLDEFIIAVDLTNIWGPDIFMPSILKILGMISVFVLLYYFLGSLHLGPLKGNSLVAAYSRGILWIYLCHLIIGFHLVQFLQSAGLVEFRILLLALLGMWIVHYYIGILAIGIKRKLENKSPQ